VLVTRSFALSKTFGRMPVYFGITRIILPPWCVATRLVPTEGLEMRGKLTHSNKFVKRQKLRLRFFGKWGDVYF